MAYSNAYLKPFLWSVFVGLVWGMSLYFVQTEDLVNHAANYPRIFFNITPISLVGAFLGGYFAILSAVASMYFSRRAFLPVFLLLLVSALLGPGVLPQKTKAQNREGPDYAPAAIFLGLPALLAVGAATIGKFLRREEVVESLKLTPTNKPINPSGGSGVF